VRAGQKEGRGRGGDAGPGISAHGRQLLGELQQEGLGDHMLLLRLYEAWEAAGQAVEWCRDLGVDGRSMRFARDIRRQLEGIVGPDGGGLEPPRGGERGRGQQRDGQQPGGQEGGKRARREEVEAGGGGKRPRRGFADAATVKALRMALTIGAPPTAAACRCWARCGWQPAAGHAAAGSEPPGHRALPPQRPATSALASLTALPPPHTHTTPPPRPPPGFANRLARRMAMHNGYRTLGQSSTLAQVGPPPRGWAAGEGG
jgi:ATP-dependent RNA helicase DHX8/PRP22